MGVSSKVLTPIAYLAPEIPGISSTFVYTEILCVQAFGIEVFPYSIHRPCLTAKSDETVNLKPVYYLYDQPKMAFVSATLTNLVLRPFRFGSALGQLLSDIFEIRKIRSIVRLLFQFGVANLLSREIIKQKIGHIHIHFGHVPTQIGMYSSCIAGIPFTFTTHANDIFERGELLVTKSRRAKKVLTISEFNRKYLIERGVPNESIEVVRCGVHPITLKGKAHKTRSETAVIGSLGRFVEKKGMDTVLSACAIVRKQGINIELKLAGSGPLEKELKELAIRLNIYDIVSFIGPILHNEVINYMYDLDVFVLASRKDKQGDMDGIPVVLMEAMTCMIPVISTRVSGIPELIENGFSGFLCEPNDTLCIAESIITAITDHETVTKMTYEAYKKVITEFSLKKNTERVLRAISE